MWQKWLEDILSCSRHGGGNPLVLRRRTISWGGTSRAPWKKGDLWKIWQRWQWQWWQWQWWLWQWWWKANTKNHIAPRFYKGESTWVRCAFGNVSSSGLPDSVGCVGPLWNHNEILRWVLSWDVLSFQIDMLYMKNKHFVSRSFLLKKDCLL